jgi:DNA polymerase-3 subunit alpha
MGGLFGHLHRHGEFSRLDGVGTAKEYASRAADLGQGFLAQTDHGTLSGALHHITACRKVGIVPIVGVEAYYRPNRKSRMTRQAWHLILLAKNLRGWHNLLRICSIAYAEQSDGGGFYQHPCIDDELLDRYSDGLICTSACFQSWLAQLISNGDSVATRDYIQHMKSRFKGDFYLEIMPHDFDEQRELNIEIARMSTEFSVPLIATNDTHFVYPNWAETQRVAKMMSTNLTFSKVEKMIEKGEEPPYMSELYPNLYLSSRQEMMQWFGKFHPDLDPWHWNSAITNTATLAQTITPFMLDRTDKLPKVSETPEEAEDILWKWISEGRSRIESEYPHEHWDKWTWETYIDRIEFEWEILKSKGAIPYMVMVGDIMRWCRSQGIKVGVRGSAAGCLISYLIGISSLDPIPWGFLFERFLNPGRKGMPDIDIDVQSDRRSEVKQYIIDKYGADHVADIITHERFQPKSVLQKLCRVFDVPFTEARAVTETIDIRQDDEETTLEELLPINEKLREFKAKYPQIWEHATRLEGSVANTGKHAAGVVITPKPIIEYMAIERGKKGDLVTSWSDSAEFMVISDNGFQKIDLLGLQGLERQDYALKLIQKRHGKRLDLNKLPALRDPSAVEPEVMAMFTSGYTIGIFQFGSKGITNLIRSIDPDTAFDLAAANALYRPGPMKGGVTWDYARIKRGDKDPPEWSKIDLVAPVMLETHGLICYQEQVMEVAKRLGGFSPAQADDLRKAMGKLYRIKGGTAAKEFMAQYTDLWIDGTNKNGVNFNIRDLIWDQFLGFGSYGFNKSHSGYYAIQAYQDAWLKKHYPLEFYASILTFPSGSSPQAKQDFMTSVAREAGVRGFKFLPPHINRSELGWTIDTEDGVEGLRYGFAGIKDVGDVASAKLVIKRVEDYTSIENVRFECGSKVNKKVIEALTEAGAFDCFGARDDASATQIAKWEKDRLKMVIKGSSETDKYAHLIEPNIFTQEEVDSIEKGSVVIVGGEITRIDRKKTKKGDDFATVTLSFGMNEWRVRFWQQQLNTFGELLEVGNTIMVHGRKDEWQGYITVTAKEATDIQTLAAEAELADDYLDD